MKLTKKQRNSIYFKVYLLLAVDLYNNSGSTGICNHMVDIGVSVKDLDNGTLPEFELFRPRKTTKARRMTFFQADGIAYTLSTIEESEIRQNIMLFCKEMTKESKKPKK